MAENIIVKIVMFLWYWCKERKKQMKLYKGTYKITFLFMAEPGEEYIGAEEELKLELKGNGLETGHLYFIPATKENIKGREIDIPWTDKPRDRNAKEILSQQETVPNLCLGKKSIVIDGKKYKLVPEKE